MSTSILLINDLRQRKTRAALTIGAVAMAVSLVVSMTSGFASLRATVYKALGTFYGDIDVVVEPADTAGSLLTQNALESLRLDDRVSSLRARLTNRSLAQRADGGGRSEHNVELIGLDPEALKNAQGNALREGSWFTDVTPQVVLDERLARRLGLTVGGLFSILTPEGTKEFNVAGLAARPSIMQMGPPSAYVPLELLQSILNRQGQVSEVEIDLKPSVDLDAFIEEYQDKAYSDGTVFRLKTVATQREKFDKNFQAVELLTYLGGTISLLAAIFIIFSTLAMGVAERTRTLAILRAIGAERSQVGRLVVFEGLILAGVGVACGIGLGYLWLNLLVSTRNSPFTAGIVLSHGGIAYATGISMLSALLASALPAYTASRVTALEAMTIVAKQATNSRTWFCGLLGLGLLTIDPAVAWVPGIEREARVLLHLYAGLPTFMIGLFLLLPAVVVLVDRLLSRSMAWVLGIQPGLLQQQLSGAVWRAAGTASALMVGLVVLVLIRTHGNTLVSAWQLPDRFPDLLIFSPFGVDREQAAKLEEVEGIRDRQVVPVALVSPKVGANIFSAGGLVAMPDATIMFGVDTAKTFGVENIDRKPMVELDFIQGDQNTAAAQLREGRNILVSEEFHKLKGLGVGSTLELDTTLNGKVAYTIVGVVRSPGIDLIARLFQIGKEFDQWTASAVATDLINVQRDFGVQRFNLLAANIDPGNDRKLAEEEVRKRLTGMGMMSAGSRMIKEIVEFVFQRILDLSSSVALMSMLVASVGVTNTIMASVRSRRWQFGVLRSIGLSRGALLRLVMAEAAMIALVAVILGIGGGLLLSISANAMAGHVIGLQPELVITARPLWISSLITLGIAICAGMIPAIRVAYSDTLRLLQGGRASA